MVDLFARIVAIFDTPAGMTVLGMAALAFAALFVIVFWDTIKTTQRDVVRGGARETAPPPLLAPDMVTRGDDMQRMSAGPIWARNAVLMSLGALFVVAGLFAIGQISEQASHRASVRASFSPAADADPSLGAPARIEEPTAHVQVDLCEETGSLTEHFVEICAGGASVRFDVLRFSQADTFVLRPRWVSNTAPRFVVSESHAAPFSFDQGVRFTAPETVAEQRYDGFLVIGVGEDDIGVAVERERALRDFAIAQLSGGDRAECSTSERVFSMSALFDRGPMGALDTLRAEVAAKRKAARRNHQDRAELAALEQELARRELLVVDRPAPIVLGITTDPHSSDPVADMHAASRAFVKVHGGDLQLQDAGAVDNFRACARGEVAP